MPFWTGRVAIQQDTQLSPADETLNTNYAVLTFLGFCICVYVFFLFLDKIREKDVAKSSLLSAF